MTTSKQRRRVIKLMAASLVACGAPQTALAMMAEHRLHHWQGFALGAEVSLQLYHHDEKAAQRIIEKAVQIIRDMESLFSLHQESSTLSSLNQQGVIHNPPAEFVELLRTAQDISRMTSGAFDITVQPLWQFYQARFSGASEGNGPIEEELRLIRDHIGYQKMSISRQKVSFDQPGMAATLNGIAQGYVTDRVSDYLKSEGLTAVLVDIGEYRALGPQADETPWRIGLADPLNFGQLSHILELNRGAVATSAGRGDSFDKNGEFHHLFDPRTGKSAQRYSSVTVTAPEATLADALSTAFYAMPVAAIKECLLHYPAVNARLTDQAGAVIIV